MCNSSIYSIQGGNKFFSFSENELSDLQQRFANAQPFPYLVIDDFLSEDLAHRMLTEFPDIHSRKHWIYYRHYNENKLGLNNPKNIPSSILSFIEILNGEKFLRHLETLTGINNLIADKSIEAGGVHVAEKGGYLNIHADFSSHPKIEKWER